MPSWSRFGSGERKSAGSVLPITSRDDNDIDVKYHSKPSPPSPRRRSSTPQQSLGMRRWIWLLLLANIVAMLFFMFASAFYFPPVVSDSVVRQALAQGDPGFKRQGELASAAPATKPTAETEFADAETENGDGYASEAPSVTRVPEGQLKQQGDVQEATSPGEKTEPTFATENAKQEPSPIVQNALETLAPVTQATVNTGDTPATEPALTQTEPPPGVMNLADKDQDVKTQSPNSIADLIVKMKERRANNNANAVVTPEERTSVPAVDQQQQHEKQSSLIPNSDQVDSTKRDGTGGVLAAALQKKNSVAGKTKNGKPLDEDGTNFVLCNIVAVLYETVPRLYPVILCVLAAIRKNLLVWLRVDKGVEVENLSECQATGDGSSCDVKAWTSQVVAVTSTHSTVAAAETFTPATRDQARPTFISNIYNRNELPALFFSCPLVNEHLKLHEYMTLFFMLSPAQIEVANTFKAQKFFGNAPYGQFFFHGGKPGFLSNGGVRELDEKVSSGIFYLLTYRLQRNSVEIKTNRQQWGRGASGGTANGEDAPFAVRMSDNAALSLGNVKAMCDTNVFQGRIAEVMIYDTILTDGRVSEVETYLEQKWWDEPFETFAPIELPPAKMDNQRPDEQSPGDGNAAVTEPGQNDNPDEAEPADQQANGEGDTIAESPQGAEHAQADEYDDAPTAATNEKEQAQISNPSPSATEPLSPAEPITFNSEDVFEWMPPEAVLTLKESAQDLVGEWKRHVRQKIEAIRGFHMGGEVLRAFIRNRKDELIALRQELFG